MFFTAFLNTNWAKSEWELSLWLHFIQIGHFQNEIEPNQSKTRLHYPECLSTTHLFLWCHKSTLQLGTSMWHECSIFVILWIFISFSHTTTITRVYFLLFMCRNDPQKVELFNNILVFCLFPLVSCRTKNHRWLYLLIFLVFKATFTSAVTTFVYYSF